MPKESQASKKPKRTAKPLQIPAIGADPQERKRQLNVLAQRNYRQRKREYLQRLESQLGAQTKATEPHNESAKKTLTSSDARLTDQDIFSKPANVSQPSSPSRVDGTYIIPEDEIETSTSRFGGAMNNADSNYTLNWSQGSLFPLQGFIDPIDRFGEHADLGSHNDAYLSTFTTPASPPPSGSSLISRSNTPIFSFPDEHCLPIYELALLRGSLAIAQCLNISPDLIWDPTAVSPFSDPANAHCSFEHLPAQFRPTPAQRQYPHHPMLDLLPWAVARTKIIVILTQPASFRPPAARSETALMDMLYDADDGAEGMKVWGTNPLDPQNWELGEKLWSRWWWAFDREIVRQSNSWRHARGARLLGHGKVLEEVS